MTRIDLHQLCVGAGLFCHKALDRKCLSNDGPPLPAAVVDRRELEACFVVIDSAGQKLAYVYFEDEPGRRSAA